MSITVLADFYRLFPIDGSLGVTVLRDISAGQINYVGVAQGWNADPSKPIWWIIKYTTTSGNPVQDQVSPPSQIYNNRASLSW